MKLKAKQFAKGSTLLVGIIHKPKVNEIKPGAISSESEAGRKARADVPRERRSKGNISPTILLFPPRNLSEPFFGSPIKFLVSSEAFFSEDFETRQAPFLSVFAV